MKTDRQRMERAALLYAEWSDAHPYREEMRDAPWPYLPGYIDCHLIAACLNKVARDLGVSCRLAYGTAIWDNSLGTESSDDSWLILADGLFDPKSHVRVRRDGEKDPVYRGFVTARVSRPGRLPRSHRIEPDAVTYVLRRMRRRASA